MFGFNVSHNHAFASNLKYESEVQRYRDNLPRKSEPGIPLSKLAKAVDEVDRQISLGEKVTVPHPNKERIDRQELHQLKSRIGQVSESWSRHGVSGVELSVGQFATILEGERRDLSKQVSGEAEKHQETERARRSEAGGKSQKLFWKGVSTAAGTSLSQIAITAAGALSFAVAGPPGLLIGGLAAGSLAASVPMLLDDPFGKKAFQESRFQKAIAKSPVEESYTVTRLKEEAEEHFLSVDQVKSWQRVLGE